MKKQELLDFVAHNAVQNFDSLTNDNKQRLLLGLAFILPKEKAEEAKHTAFMLRKAEEQQLKFFDLFQSCQH